MLIRPTTEVDAEAGSALIMRSYDQVLVQHHSLEMLPRVRETAARRLNDSASPAV